MGVGSTGNIRNNHNSNVHNRSVIGSDRRDSINSCRVMRNCDRHIACADIDWVVLYRSVFRSMSQYIHLLHGDSKAVLNSYVPPASIDLVVTSPPYNVGKSYEEGTTDDDYADLITSTCTGLKRVLKPDGRFAVNVPHNMFVGGVNKHVSLLWENALLEAGLVINDIIIWNKSQHVAGGCAWGSWRSASSPYIRHTAEFILMGYNCQWKKLNKGISTISKDDFISCSINVWNMSPSNSRYHPAVFPDELPRRCIELLSYQDDVVLDPFVGSGTTMRVARALGRSCIGIEQDDGYVKYIADTILFQTLLDGEEIEYKYITDIE